MKLLFNNSLHNNIDYGIPHSFAKWLLSAELFW